MMRGASSSPERRDMVISTMRSYGRKLHFRWSRDQCSAKREKWLHFSVGLGFGIRLGLGYDSGYWLGLGLGLGLGLEFGSEIRAQGLQK